MTTVPRMTLVLPLRRRLSFTTNYLPTALLHASRDHEVIIVLDECDLSHEVRRHVPHALPNLSTILEQDVQQRALVTGWIEDHKALLDSYGVRVLRSQGDASCWTGGLRSAFAHNLGARAATTDWVFAFGDEDLCFQPGWDRAFWQSMEWQDPSSCVGTVTMTMPEIRESWPEPWSASWIHEQRNVCCHKLTFPLLATEALDMYAARISHRTFQAFAAAAALPNIHEEMCGKRTKAHWVPLLMHKDLYWSAGGLPVSDHAAYSYDLVFDDLLGARGIRKRVTEDHLVLHTPQHYYLSDEVDEKWVGSDLRASLARARII